MKGVIIIVVLIAALVVVVALHQEPSSDPCDTGSATTSAQLVSSIICNSKAEPTTTESNGQVRVIYSLKPWALTASVEKWTFYNHVRKIIPAVFAKFKEPNKIDIVGTAEFKDIRGNVGEIYAMRVVFTRSNAATIQWDNIDVDNIPRIADSAWIHPGL
jgi:hypothetical protein